MHSTHNVKLKPERNSKTWWKSSILWKLIVFIHAHTYMHIQFTQWYNVLRGATLLHMYWDTIHTSITLFCFIFQNYIVKFGRSRLKHDRKQITRTSTFNSGSLYFSKEVLKEKSSWTVRKHFYGQTTGKFIGFPI